MICIQIPFRACFLGYPPGTHCPRSGCPGNTPHPRICISEPLPERIPVRETGGVGRREKGAGRQGCGASARPTGSSAGARPSPRVAQGGRVWACGLSARPHPWMDDAWKGSLWSGWAQSWVRATPKGDSVSAASTPGSWDDSCPAMRGALGGAHWYPVDPVSGWMPVPHLGRGLQIGHLEHVGG